MFKSVVIMLIVSFIFLTGCMASGPIFSPVEKADSGKAVVYIYRPFTIFHCMWAPDIYIDEVKHGPLKNNGYLVYFIEPGKRIIEIRGTMFSETTTFLTLYPDLDAGKDYYFRLSIGSSKYVFAQIKKEYAISEITGTKKSD